MLTLVRVMPASLSAFEKQDRHLFPGDTEQDFVLALKRSEVALAKILNSGTQTLLAEIRDQQRVKTSDLEDSNIPAVQPAKQQQVFVFLLFFFFLFSFFRFLWTTLLLLRAAFRLCRIWWTSRRQMFLSLQSKEKEIGTFFKLPNISRKKLAKEKITKSCGKSQLFFVKKVTF
jgi:hypothetical protein